MEGVSVAPQLLSVVNRLILSSTAALKWQRTLVSLSRQSDESTEGGKGLKEPATAG